MKAHDVLQRGDLVRCRYGNIYVVLSDRIAIPSADDIQCRILPITVNDAWSREESSMVRIEHVENFFIMAWGLERIGAIDDEV